MLHKIIHNQKDGIYLGTVALHSWIYLNAICALFFGQCLQVTLATNQIVMNCADIDIITASFAAEGGEGESEFWFTLLFYYVLPFTSNDR